MRQCFLFTLGYKLHSGKALEELVTFARSIYRDSLETAFVLKPLVLVFVIMMPLALELLPRVTGGKAPTAPITVMWSFLMFFSFRFVLRGHNLYLPGTQGLGRFILKCGLMAVFCVLGVGGLVIFLPGIERLDINSAGGGFFIVMLVLSVGLCVYSLIGTWLPSHVARVNSGLRPAIGRMRSQAVYIATRLVVMLVPIVLVILALFLILAFSHADLSLFDAQWHINPLGLIIYPLFFALVSFGHIVVCVVLARAYIRFEHKAGEIDGSRRIPYLGSGE